MTTGGLCDPSWSPDGKTFAAAGVRGVFTFTEPNFEPRVLVAGPAAGAGARRAGAARVRRSGVVAERRPHRLPVQRRRRLADRGGGREERRGPPEARRSGEGAALGGRADARSSTRRACPSRDRRPPASERPMTERPGRRGYLDWMRGLAVVIMVGWHTLDAWTTPVDKASGAFWYCQLIGGFGAPIFLFLAGVSVALAAGSRLRKAFRASPGPGPGAPRLTPGLRPASSRPPPASSRPPPGRGRASARPPPGLGRASARAGPGLGRGVADGEAGRVDLGARDPVPRPVGRARRADVARPAPRARHRARQHAEGRHPQRDGAGDRRRRGDLGPGADGRAGGSPGRSPRRRPSPSPRRASAPGRRSTRCPTPSRATSGRSPAAPRSRSFRGPASCSPAPRSACSSIARATPHPSAG